MASINGTANADNLTGTADGDGIYGYAGNDTLSGLAGSDYLQGGDGNDSLNGGDDGDTLYGNAGADRLDGGTGDDYFYIYDNDGPDTIDGGAGDDYLYLSYYYTTTGQSVTLGSGSASDGSSWQNIERLSFYGSSTGADSATGGAGADNLNGEGGNDTLVGLAGSDYLYGDDGNDSLSGGDDGDSLYGNAGADRLDGGAGDDYFYVYSNEGADTIDGGAGNDYLYLDYTSTLVGQRVALASGNATDGSTWQNIERFTFYGSEAGNDSASGSAGQDVLYGRGGNDTLAGLGGSDYLYGDEGDDDLSGGDDADSLYGEAGADRLDGGPGDDYFYVYGIDGSDTIIGGAGTDYLYLDYSAVVGGLNFDFASGTASDGSEWQGVERFTFYGSETGADSVTGGGTSLYVYAGGGADSLTGSSQADYLYGEEAADWLAGGGGTDFLEGGDGADTLIGGDGTDYLYGRLGADLLAGDAGNDYFYLETGEGADTLEGGAGTDYAYLYDWVSTDFRLDTQGDGSILLTDINLANGNDGVYTLRSIEWAYFSDKNIQLGTDNSGDEDYDLSGPGGGTVAGGDGNDTYIVDDPNDRPVEQAGGGIDTVRASISWTLGANLDNLVLTGTADLSGTGNLLPNEITGNSGRNSLDGGAGADTLRGGAGGDTYYIDDPLDQVIETATSSAGRGAAALLRAERLVDGLDERPADTAQDADTIVASLGRAVLSAYVESGVLAEGSAARELIGNVLANDVQGNSAGNLLQGGAGNDTLSGGEGIDVAAYSGNRGDYTVTVNAATITVTDNNAADGNEGVDTLSSIEALRFADQVFELGGLSVDDGTAAGDAVDLGSAGMQAGAGGAGDDTYTVNAPGDAVIERPNQGTDTVRASINWTLWENIEHLVLTGAAVQGAGNAEHNTITGNDAANLLLGYAGNDTLNGGAGADTLRGGIGNDSYVVGSGDVLEERAGEGTDTVQSAQSFTLAAELERLTLTGSAAVNGTGNSGNNAITGNGAINRLDGGWGNDTLNGAAGKDSLIGGAGNDTYVVTSGDKLTEQPGGGTDTVQSAVSWTLAANLEKLTLTGSKAINGTGSSGPNTLTGNGGANVLKGSGGNDTLVGGGGNDALVGGAGSDRLTGSTGADAFVFETALSAGSNRDTITDFTTGSDKLRLDDDIFTAFDAAQSAALASGALRAGAGVAAAADADDRILYNTTTGALYYDADGTGVVAPVQFAVLGTSTHPGLAASDFVIVG